MCTIIYSQENSSSPKYALSFGIADNFRLDKFNMDFAFKKIIDETHQLRFFLSPRISTNNQEVNTSGNIQTQESKLLNYSLGVGVDYLWTLMSNEDINMFGGTGLVFTYGNNNNKSTDNYSNGDKINNEVNNPYINLGIRGIIGVEWKVSKKIGIHSEYLFTGSYNWDKSESISSVNGVDNPTSTRTSSGISLGSGVLFGVSIYL
jgi:hypothetical protein